MDGVEVLKIFNNGSKSSGNNVDRHGSEITAAKA
jgi:hypothetical protein